MKPDRSAAVLAAAILLISGCDQAMSDQPKRKPFQESSFFADGRSSRVPVAGKIPQGGLRLDDHFHRGLSGGEFASQFPAAVTADTLRRGRERYDIFCSPCHDRTGSGRGMIVQRGYRPPPSFHLDRLRQAPPGYLFDVVTRGLGAMPGYSEQVRTADRWAIIAYLRALQLSRLGDVNDLPRARIGRQIEKELAPAGAREHIRDPLAHERPAFLLHQNLERAPGVGCFCGRRKLDVAVFGHMPALGAIAPARRR